MNKKDLVNHTESNNCLSIESRYIYKNPLDKNKSETYRDVITSSVWPDYRKIYEELFGNLLIGQYDKEDDTYELYGFADQPTGRIYLKHIYESSISAEIAHNEKMNPNALLINTQFGTLEDDIIRGKVSAMLEYKFSPKK